jgi:hypothetical protein
VGHALRSSGLLHVKVSWARVFQSGIKTGGGVTAGGARTPSRRLSRGCVGPCYSCFTVFLV